jgi:fructose-1,6-bisphosphatase
VSREAITLTRFVAAVVSEELEEIRPESLHQSVPLAIGSREDVELYEKFHAGGGS